MSEGTNVGIIGCGAISDTYLRVAQSLEALNIVACADLIPERARNRADEYDLRALSVEELLADDEVEIVVNLTVPAAHGSIAMAALEAGK